MSQRPKPPVLPSPPPTYGQSHHSRSRTSAAIAGGISQGTQQQDNYAPVPYIIPQVTGNNVGLHGAPNVRTHRSYDQQGFGLVKGAPMGPILPDAPPGSAGAPGFDSAPPNMPVDMNAPPPSPASGSPSTGSSSSPDMDVEGIAGTPGTGSFPGMGAPGPIVGGIPQPMPPAMPQPMNAPPPPDAMPSISPPPQAMPLNMQSSAGGIGGDPGMGGLGLDGDPPPPMGSPMEPPMGEEDFGPLDGPMDAPGQQPPFSLGGAPPVTSVSPASNQGAPPNFMKGDPGGSFKDFGDGGGAPKEPSAAPPSSPPGGGGLGGDSTPKEPSAAPPSSPPGGGGGGLGGLGSNPFSEKPDMDLGGSEPAPSSSPSAPAGGESGDIKDLSPKIPEHKDPGMGDGGRAPFQPFRSNFGSGAHQGLVGSPVLAASQMFGGIMGDPSGGELANQASGVVMQGINKLQNASGRVLGSAHQDRMDAANRQKEKAQFEKNQASALKQLGPKPEAPAGPPEGFQDNAPLHYQEPVNMAPPSVGSLHRGINQTLDNAMYMLNNNGSHPDPLQHASNLLQKGGVFGSPIAMKVSVGSGMDGPIMDFFYGTPFYAKAMELCAEHIDLEAKKTLLPRSWSEEGKKPANQKKRKDLEQKEKECDAALLMLQAKCLRNMAQNCKKEDPTQKALHIDGGSLEKSIHIASRDTRTKTGELFKAWLFENLDDRLRCFQGSPFHAQAMEILADEQEIEAKLEELPSVEWGYGAEIDSKKAERKKLRERMRSCKAKFLALQRKMLVHQARELRQADSTQKSVTGSLRLPNLEGQTQPMSPTHPYVMKKQIETILDNAMGMLTKGSMEKGDVGEALHPGSEAVEKNCEDSVPVEARE